jgi:hypothetical protein
MQLSSGRQLISRIPNSGSLTVLRPADCVQFAPVIEMVCFWKLGTDAPPSTVYHGAIFDEFVPFEFCYCQRSLRMFRTEERWFHSSLLARQSNEYNPLATLNGRTSPFLHRGSRAEELVLSCDHEAETMAHFVGIIVALKCPRWS